MHLSTFHSSNKTNLHYNIIYKLNKNILKQFIKTLFTPNVVLLKLSTIYPVYCRRMNKCYVVVFIVFKNVCMILLDKYCFILHFWYCLCPNNSRTNDRIFNESSYNMHWRQTFKLIFHEWNSWLFLQCNAKINKNRI